MWKYCVDEQEQRPLESTDTMKDHTISHQDGDYAKLRTNQVITTINPYCIHVTINVERDFDKGDDGDRLVTQSIIWY